ncbi:MAG: DUF4367 domain-containing protein [Oscillospiraceae bacterium]|nr:DUF4367 domain-containing protein [Oscillospiraceae bacterium]
MTLKNVLEDICAEEYALPANAPAHRFSRRHRRAVNAVLYPDGLTKTERKLPLKRRVLVAAVIATLAVVTGAAAAAAVIYHYNGFDFIKENDKYFGEYYIMLVKNIESAPKTIEKIIYEDNVPEDFTLWNTSVGEGVDEGRFFVNYYISTERVNKFGEKGALIGIHQCTKNFFVDPIMEEYIVTPVEIKGCKGYAISAEEAMDVVVWDSGDYIHVVNGLLSVEELLEIAENMVEK